jgi:hypothetical protein
MHVVGVISFLQQSDCGSVVDECKYCTECGRHRVAIQTLIVDWCPQMSDKGNHSQSLMLKPL